MKKTFLAALAALALTAAAACAATVGAFTARDLDGKTHTQELLGGAKLTVFNAWGTFCPPCLREMPDLGKLAEELKPEGVQIVGLLCDWFDRRGGESPRRSGSGGGTSSRSRGSASRGRCPCRTAGPRRSRRTP